MVLMARPSKKGIKTEAEVMAEAKRKKEILDKVAQSNMPTKTILKELGISRSTYYSWLKRYEEEGEEGLVDSRSLATGAEEVEDAVEEIQPQPPVTVTTEEVGEEKLPEPVDTEVIEEEPTPPPPEEPVVSPAPVEQDEVVQPEEPVAAPAQVEPDKTEEETIPEPVIPPRGEREKKGLGGYGFIAVVLLIVGLLVSISIDNHGTYQLRENSNTLTLWQGKFAPRGYQLVEGFEPVEVGDADVSALTSRKFSGREAVNRAIFAFFIDQVNGETARGDEADVGKMNVLLSRAEAFAEVNGSGDAGLKSMRFQLAQQRVGMAELGLHKAYKKALPIYQEALQAGLGDAATLEAKVEAMQKALGLVPVLAPEAPEQQAVVSPTEEEAGKEAAITAPPETESTEAEAPAVVEEPAKEEEVVVTPGAGAEEMQGSTTVESSTVEGETVPADTETDATVEQTNSEEKADKPTSFMQWLKAKQQ
jgi:outer membrane biosynthesis protein TonB